MLAWNTEKLIMAKEATKKLDKIVETLAREGYKITYVGAYIGVFGSKVN